MVQIHEIISIYTRHRTLYASFVTHTHTPTKPHISTQMMHSKSGLNPRNSSHRISQQNKYPVVIFLTGGAWIIGYKAWGAFMGMLLAQLGVIFVSPDYRNFPQGTISDMVEDATNAVQWTKENIHKYGGDKHNMYIVSQSAGAHIGALMMLLQARKNEIYNKLKAFLIDLKHKRKQNKLHTVVDDDRTSLIERVEKEIMSDNYKSLWNPQADIKAFIGIAGPYNIEGMKYYLEERGLYLDVMDKIMENNLRSASPLYCLYDLFLCPNDAEIKSMQSILAKKLRVNTSDEHENGRLVYVDETLGNQSDLDRILNSKVKLKLPAVYLFHGSADLSCPVSNTKTFSLALASYGVETFVKIYANKSHTAPIIEDPITGL